MSEREEPLQRHTLLRKFTFLILPTLLITAGVIAITLPLSSNADAAQNPNSYQSLLAKITQTMQGSLKDGEKAEMKCESEVLLTKKISNTEYHLICVKKNPRNTVETAQPTVAGASIAPTQSPSPTDHPHQSVMPSPTVASATNIPATGGVAERGQKCPESVHATFTTTGPDGKTYPTWHPPEDPQSGCWFGHEHGSDPSTFPAIAQVGMPAFGYTAAQHGMEEPHVGFKVYVVNDSDRNRYWMSTFHMGTSGPKRAFEPMHTHDLAVIRADNKQVLANVHLMANTGASVPKCKESDAQNNIIPNSAPAGTGVGKVVPTSDCSSDAYEAWGADSDIGDYFHMDATFDVDNGITMIKKNADGTFSNTETVFTASVICEDQSKVFLPNQGPTTRQNYPYYTSGDCNRAGDKRGYRLPHLTLNNTTGNQEIWTDAFGKVQDNGQGIKQIVSTSEKLNDDQTYGWKTPIFTNYDPTNSGDLSTYYDLNKCNKDFCGPFNMAGDAFITYPN